MTQPAFVPIAEADQVRPALRLETPRPWTPTRAGEARDAVQPTGRDFGRPGPDQGYVLHVAHKLFAERVELTPGEKREDAIVGSSMVASARAGLFGRAPVGADVEHALTLFGFLGDAPAELVTWRKAEFRSAAHHYEVQRGLVDTVPERTLRLTAHDVRARLGEWRTLLTLDGAN